MGKVRELKEKGLDPLFPEPNFGGKGFEAGTDLPHPGNLAFRGLALSLCLSDLLGDPVPECPQLLSFLEEPAALGIEGQDLVQGKGNPPSLKGLGNSLGLLADDFQINHGGNI